MANRKKTHSRRKPAHHLPKVGTPADDAYRLRRSREDLVDFGLGPRGAGPVRWIVAGAALVLLVLGVLALVAIT